MWTVTICEMFATELVGRPDSRAGTRTLPGAAARVGFVVRATAMTVRIALTMEVSVCTITIGRRSPGSEPAGRPLLLTTNRPLAALGDVVRCGRHPPSPIRQRAWQRRSPPPGRPGVRVLIHLGRAAACRLPGRRRSMGGSMKAIIEVSGRGAVFTAAAAQVAAARKGRAPHGCRRCAGPV